MKVVGITFPKVSPVSSVLHLAPGGELVPYNIIMGITVRYRMHTLISPKLGDRVTEENDIFTWHPRDAFLEPQTLELT